MKFYSNNHGHVTKMAAMSIYVENCLKTFFSGTKRRMAMKFGIQHKGPRPYKVCTNDDPGFIFLMAKSFLLRNAFYGKRLDHWIL